MKIVLRHDVPKLGEAGTVHNVADGYARNFLIPRGMAVIATSGELKVVAHNQEVQARKIAKQEQLLQSLADRIAGQRLEFTARAGEQGRLYGSITAGDVAERLTAAVREEIDRRRVVLDDPIRTVGEHTVTVHLVGRLRPQVTVVVHGEHDETEDPASPEPVAAEAPSLRAGAQRRRRASSDTEESEHGPGSSGHPEPGSQHHDSETETVQAGPEVEPVDGIPGAFGDVETRGGAEIESNVAGPGAEIEEETNS